MTSHARAFSRRAVAISRFHARRASEACPGDVPGRYNGMESVLRMQGGTPVARASFITENDELFRMFGMQLEEAREGYARLSARVRPEFVNAYGVAHGGFIFALADMAFAIAASSITDAVAVQWSLNMFRAAAPGELISAECIILHRGESVIVVGLNVLNSEGKAVARGQATSLPVEIERFEKASSPDSGD